MEAYFAIMHEKNKEAYRLLSQGPEQVIITYEDADSKYISPSVYRKYCAPMLNEYAEICHAGGKLFLTAMGGKLAAFNPELRAGYQDGIDMVCPPTTGDTWPYQARDAWGIEKIIVGGLEPSALVRMNVEETRQYTTAVLDQMPTFSRFILRSGDATAHGTPVANLRAVSEVVSQYPWK
jgi:uroporphyrinogen-III decarboxylase